MTDPHSSTTLSAKQGRAARAILAWSQQDLASAAGVGSSTVADFERGSRTPVPNNVRAMREALENAGITFSASGAVGGPSVPNVAKRTGKSLPVRWVSAEDLNDWANRTDGAVSLPTLISTLISASHGGRISLRFPSDESTRHGGWDGRTSATHASDFVPDGESGWELGVQRDKIGKKASGDYSKRTGAPGDLDPSNSTFVFVTLRRWSGKDSWVRARTKEGRWRSVKAYDADDLVHWIERTPAVGLWLANRLGKRPPGIRELDEVWKEWSLATRWPLSEELVLSGRDEQAAEILRWLRGEPSVTSLQAATAEEVVAFLHAALSELPPELCAPYRARTLVAATTSAARGLSEAPAPLIVVMMEPEPGLARSLSQRGHYVLQAYDDRLVSDGAVRALSRPSREGIEIALAGMGIEESQAKQFARDCARNLAVLRRRIPFAPGRAPKWAESPTPALLSALLVGGWDHNSESDRQQLSDLAGQPYDSIIPVLAPLLGELDSPIQRVGSTWRVASPIDAWFLLAQHLTAVDVTRFETAVLAILQSGDPRFAMSGDERWMAPIRGVRPPYSVLLRRGVGQTLILLALWGERVRAVPDATRRAERVVAEILRDADRHRWWSLARDFRMLAEASPEAFLNAVERSLDKADPTIGALFDDDPGVFAGTEHLSDLLWALESLAWSPEWMPRVSAVLARLDDLDVKPRRYSNGPLKSLREIHIFWNPQTYTKQADRLRVVDSLRKRHPGAAWKLMLGILPHGHDSSTPSPTPRWRDFGTDEAEAATWALIGRGASAISSRLLEDVGQSFERWSQLLDRFRDLALQPADAITALEAVEPTVLLASEREAFWNKLRDVLNHHRRFPNAEWSLDEPTLDRIEVVYDRFAPLGVVPRTQWLFQNSVSIPKPSASGWPDVQREVDEQRQRAALDIFRQGGVAAVLELARLSDAAGHIGAALVAADLDRDELDAVLVASATSTVANERGVAHGIVVSLFPSRGRDWATKLIARAQAEGWTQQALGTILHALPVERWTWERIEELGVGTIESYWRRVNVSWNVATSDDATYAIRKLVEVGRARDALCLTAEGEKLNVPTDLLVEVLRGALRPTGQAGTENSDTTMLQHYVAETFRSLDKRDDLESNDLISLEWSYLRLLEHSSRPVTELVKSLSTHSERFLEMLCAVYKPSEESGVEEPEPTDPDDKRLVAEQAYRLLSIFDRLPGTRDDGSIDGDVLDEWIDSARARATVVGRLEVTDEKIGELLSASPVGTDGNWPAEAVRSSLDRIRSERVLDGFVLGKANRRGVTCRMPGDGGRLEREEAAKYRTWAKAIAFDHPQTSGALSDLARRYESDAKRHDEDSERFDWEA